MVLSTTLIFIRRQKSKLDKTLQMVEQMQQYSTVRHCCKITKHVLWGFDPGRGTHCALRSRSVQCFRDLWPKEQNGHFQKLVQDVSHLNY